MKQAFRLATVGLFWLTGCFHPAFSQAYPSKPIRVVLPYPAGSIVDALMRQVSVESSSTWGQPLIMENRPGGNDIIAMSACAKAPPDGYTVCVLGRSLTTLPSLYAKLPVDPERDFKPVTLLVFTTLALVAHPSAGARSFREFVAVAKSNPQSLNYGSTGMGSMGSLLMEYINKKNGFDIVHVPYKGPPNLLQALLSGEVKVAYLSLVNFTGYHAAGKVRILGISSGQRLAHLPEIPTLAEQGLDDLDIRVWFGLFAPAATSSDSVEKLHREVARIFAMPSFRDKNLVSAGFEPVASAPGEFSEFLKANRVIGAEMVRISGARLE
jgi:tripartite-type tricarboxylate transporter receptor subunit TctC